MILGAIIYAADTDDTSSQQKLHAGFALVIIAAVIEIVGGVFMFISPTDEG